LLFGLRCKRWLGNANPVPLIRRAVRAEIYIYSYTAANCKTTRTSGETKQRLTSKVSGTSNASLGNCQNHLTLYKNWTCGGSKVVNGANEGN
jgi:hypothetical protein